MTNRTSIIGEMEARKLPTRQDKDGNFIISFSVHPDDAKAKPDLLTAAPGTPFAVRYCTVDYDNPEPPAPEKKRERRERKLSERLALACKDWDFWRYLRTLGYDGVEDANDADIAVKMYCLIKSKTECDVPGSNAEFAVQGLLDGYYDWKRTDARYSGTPAYEASR